VVAHVRRKLGLLNRPSTVLVAGCTKPFSLALTIPGPQTGIWQLVFVAPSTNAGSGTGEGMTRREYIEQFKRCKTKSELRKLNREYLRQLGTPSKHVVSQEEADEDLDRIYNMSSEAQKPPKTRG